jgi:hypothetical protein
MILFYIIAGIILWEVLPTVYDKYISNGLITFLDRIRFGRDYSKKLSVLQEKINTTNLDDISSNINKLNSDIQITIREFEETKRNSQVVEQKRLEKYLSPTKISDTFLN